MSYHLSTLPNGMRVASETIPGALTAAFAIAVDVGARHELPNEGGMSHLLEHMAFKGTATKNAREIAEEFDRMGGNVNAYTSHEHTVYYAKVLTEYADEALRLLCDIVANSVFDASELEREREVILQEIAMHQDSPDDLVFDLFHETAFSGQPLGRSILGMPEAIAGYSRDALVQFVEKHYEPARMVMAGVGNLNHGEVEKTVAEFFAHRTNRHAKPADNGAHYVGGEKTLEKDLEQVQLVIGFPGVATGHADYYATQVFATVLGGGMSSRLFQEIREKRGLAYSVSAFASGYQDVGVLAIYAGTTQDHLAELMAAIRSVLADVKNGVSEAELLRAKNQMKANLVITRESTGSIAEWIARHLHVYGRYRTAEELLQVIERVSTADLVRIAEACLATTQPTIAALGPHGSLATAQLAAKLAA